MDGAAGEPRKSRFAATFSDVPKRCARRLRVAAPRRPNLSPLCIFISGRILLDGVFVPAAVRNRVTRATRRGVEVSAPCSALAHASGPWPLRPTPARLPQTAMCRPGSHTPKMPGTPRQRPAQKRASGAPARSRPSSPSLKQHRTWSGGPSLPILLLFLCLHLEATACRR